MNEVTPYPRAQEETELLRINKSGNRATVYLTGDLDHCAALSLRRQIENTLSDRKITSLHLDFSGVGFMDSSGVGVILGRYKKVRDGGGFMVVRNPGERVDRILMMSGVYRVMDRL